MKLRLENDDVRFTGNGQIAIIDAIAALGSPECPACIWDNLKRKHPTLKGIFHTATIDGEVDVPVADSESWDIIQNLLFEYLVENNV